MNSTNVNVIETSEWTQGSSGKLPARVVLWKREDKEYKEVYKHALFITHIEVNQENGELSFIWGHYDLNLEEAIADFNRRVESLK
jgi:hypothetical protein